MDEMVKSRHERYVLDRENEEMMGFFKGKFTERGYS